MTSLQEQQRRAGTLWQEFLQARNPVLLAVAYLFYLTLAEMLTVQTHTQVGVFLHLVGLFLLLLHTALTWDRPQHRFLLALALVPLIRVVSLALPLLDFPLVYWYLITSVPLFAAAAVVMRLLGMGRRDLGFSPRVSIRHWLLQILFGLGGLLLGYVEYLILRPDPLVPSFTWQQIWLPALILLISTGNLEELIFRRIMQRTAIEQLGPWPGVVYVALFFAVLHIGYHSLADILFVFAVGVLFGEFVRRTGSLVGVTLAHGLTNIALFLIVPFWAAGALPLPDMPRPALPDLSGFNARVVLEAIPRLPGASDPSAVASITPSPTPGNLQLSFTPTPAPRLAEPTPPAVVTLAHPGTNAPASVCSVPQKLVRLHIDVVGELSGGRSLARTVYSRT